MAQPAEVPPTTLLDVPVKKRVRAGWRKKRDEGSTLRVGGAPAPNLRAARDFLFPPMPGAFSPDVVKAMDIADLRKRYIQVLSATMGNHSVAMFYCCWTQDEFEDALNGRFKKAISNAKSALADRAMFIMHRSMGLIDSAEEIGPINAQVSAALAKVVEKLKEKDVDQETGGGFRLVVEGLDRKSKHVPETGVVQ